MQNNVTLRRLSLHHKDIKAIRKQLKTNCTGNDCRAISQKVLDEVLASYDSKKEVETDKLELLGIEQQKLTSGMMDLNGMARFIESHEHDVLFRLNRKRRNPSCLQDKELIFIDNILDDTIINRLLSYDGFTPSMREFFPSNFLNCLSPALSVFPGRCLPVPTMSAIMEFSTTIFRISALSR
jgi:hypothetical protein